MSTDIWEEIEADADAFEKLTTKAGGELSALIKQVLEIKRDLASLEETVKETKSRRDHYLHT